MAKQRVNDWVLGVEIDTSSVEQGIKKIERMMKRLNNLPAIRPRINIAPTFVGGAKVSQSSSSRNLGADPDKAKQKVEAWEAAVKRVRGNIEDFGIASNNSFARLGVVSEVVKNEFDAIKEKSNALFSKLDKSKTPVALTEVRTELMRIKREYQELFKATKASAAGDLKSRNLEIGVYDLNKRISDFKKTSTLKFPKGSMEESLISNKIEALKESLKNVDSHQALKKVSADLRQAAREAVLLERNLNSAKKKMTALQFAGKSFKASLLNLARGPLSAFALVGAGAAVFNTTKQLGNLKSQFLAASGSADEAAKNFEYVRHIAYSLGTDLQTSAEGFAKITIAAKNSGMTLEDSKHIFLAALEASRAFGLNAENQEGILKAFTQMLSKGKIGMEELNGQLGDRAPIAITAMAKAIGKTTPQLMKLMENGKLSSKEVLKLATVIREMARAGGALDASTSSVQASTDRLVLKWQEFVGVLAGAGGENGMKTMLDLLSVVLDDLKPVAAALGWTFNYIAEGLANIYSKIRQILSLGFADTVQEKVAQESKYNEKINTAKYKTGFLGSTPQSTNNVNIHVNGVSDPKAVAREVDNRLQMMNRRNVVPSS